MNKLILALGAMAAMAGSAQAQTVVSDTDGSGGYSIEEMKAAYPEMTASLFSMIDVNGDGEVDADELAAARESGTIAK
ncbi:EF-hand domain-containing protein [Albidovulum sp.]